MRRNRLGSLNKPHKIGSPALRNKSGMKIPVAGYESKLSITEDGIVKQGEGNIYCTTAGGDFVSVLMSDGSGVLHKIVRSTNRNDIPSVGYSQYTGPSDSVIGE